MKKVVWLYGLIAGVLVSSFMAFNTIKCCRNPELMMDSTSMILGFLSMFIAFSFIFVAVKSYRDRNNQGIISFGRALTIGLLITLIASTMYVVVWAFVYHFAIPDFMDVYADFMVKKAGEEGTTAEMQAKLVEMNKMKEMYKNPLFFALITYSEILPVGILVSLICALILKRKSAKQVEAYPETR